MSLTLRKIFAVRRVDGWFEQLFSVAFNPQSDGEVAVGGEKKVRVANINLPNPFAAVLETSDRIVTDWHVVAMTPDSTLISALTSDQFRIYFWRYGAEGYKPVENLTIVSPSRLSGMALHPNGNTIATLN